MPNSSGSIRLPIVSAPLHVVFHRAVWMRPRYSNETPRMISPKSTSTSARYRAENHVAYQSGNAANVAPPATMSQTSLPSQNGPIVLIATRRSRSVFPTTVCNAPTPKSNPSRTKNPVQKKAMMMNQTICKPMGIP